MNVFACKERPVARRHAAAPPKPALSGSAISVRLGRRQQNGHRDSLPVDHQDWRGAGALVQHGSEGLAAAAPQKAARQAAARQQRPRGGHRKSAHHGVEKLPVLPVIEIIGALGDGGFRKGMSLAFRLCGAQQILHNMFSGRPRRVRPAQNIFRYALPQCRRERVHGAVNQGPESRDAVPAVDVTQFAVALRRA